MLDQNAPAALPPQVNKKNEKQKQQELFCSQKFCLILLYDYDCPLGQWKLWATTHPPWVASHPTAFVFGNPTKSFCAEINNQPL